MNEQIKRTLKLLPDRPGVYIMKNNGGQIIYVGKAKNLANRVRSYFHSPDGLNIKTRALVESVCDLSYIVVDSELEALLLENNLIKEHKPYYNILLKDDKGYPYIRFNVKDKYPSLTLARRRVYDSAEYFGPFLGAGLARDIIDAVNDIYPLRSCNADIDKRKGKMRPCVKYSIGKCAGPCRKEYRPEQYQELVDGALNILNDGYNAISEMFKRKMQKASSAFDYEKAAYYRDRMLQLQKINQSQKVVLDKEQDADVIALSVRDHYAVFAWLFVRKGKLVAVNTREFPFALLSRQELMEQFIMQKYSQGEVIPKEIFISVACESGDAVQKHLSDMAGHSVKLTVPQRGQKLSLVKLAMSNADEVMEKSYSAELARQSRIQQGLQELKDMLGLNKLPARIECFDISHIQGTDTVASMTVLTDGLPNKKEYRRFRIKHGLGNNDFASMAEVISRRFTRAVASNDKADSFSVLPDLLVIDGGKGQLSVACKELSKLGLKLNTIGLAERFEEIYLPGKSLPLNAGLDSPAVHLLQTVRDEAHRFAITYHKSLRSKRGLLSRLDNIAGIGEKRKKALFKQFGSVENIKKATLEQLLNVDGMNTAAAQAVLSYFAADEAKTADINSKDTINV